ncbi:quinol:cytochrome C oxidoreductase [Flavobacterium zepuense]|uniref:Quinol:cytochrome C oxidoreductase n=1 Tax=Flavobacterium zepuense TaxID=2593302 RepID=A0A552V7R4_9FLAO|nr:quinol:cytochrome C oxidoreductase [Flavobacterium zepuense]TRW26513.1 quinol:cytochrome C oxidoreductase [Flavobacterium zepuense]
MYTFSSKLRTFAFILMVLGALGVGYSFFTAPSTVEEAEAIVAAGHHGGHGEAEHHDETAAEAHGHDAAEADAHNAAEPATDSVVVNHTEEEVAHTAPDSASPVAIEEHADTLAATAEAHHDAASPTGDAAEAGHEGHAHSEVAAAHEGHDAHADHDAHKEHAEHVFHQLQNKPWAALYVAALFFTLLSLGALAFYGIQNAAQAGWSPVLFRVMEGITSYLIPGCIIVFLLLVAGVLHFHHLFIWLDPEVVAKDHLIQGKSGYLNGPFFLIRAAIFMGGWIFYRQYSRKNSLLQDEATDNSYYKKNFKAAAAFLVFFIVSESIMSWDWIMSVDPHWYSTLFGWYVFASFFVSGITTIALITLYLKSRGYLEYVNTSHIHDLAKFMFGISVFWTYLWFSQFMLMWYADIPEEVVYFKMRIENYNLPFFGMVVMNFVLPILILINTDFKRLSWIVVLAGTIILCGHYVDFYNMIMPATVGDQWFIGAGEIGAVMFFLGLFILVVFTTLTKQPLLAKRNPLIEESKHFQY